MSTYTIPSGFSLGTCLEKVLVCFYIYIYIFFLFQESRMRMAKAANWVEEIVYFSMNLLDFLPFWMPSWTPRGCKLVEFGEGYIIEQ